MLTPMQMPTQVNMYINFQIVHIINFKAVIYLDQACNNTHLQKKLSIKYMDPNLMQ